MIGASKPLVRGTCRLELAGYIIYERPLSFKDKLSAYRLNERSILRGALHKLGSCVFSGLVPLDHELVRGTKALWSRTLFTRHCHSKHLGLNFER